MSLLDKLIWNSAKRKQEMQQFSADINWSYDEIGNPGIIKQLEQFKLFKFGSSRKIKNLIYRQELQTSYQIFDYQYEINTGKSSHVYRQSVFFGDSKLLSLPQFYQKPEDFLEKLMQFLGLDDIDFEKFPEYSDKYHLKGEFESVIRYYFSEDILTLLSNQFRLHMEGMNYYFILYQNKKVIPAAQMTSFKNLGLMLSELFHARSSEASQLLKI